MHLRSPTKTSLLLLVVCAVGCLPPAGLARRGAAIEPRGPSPQAPLFESESWEDVQALAVRLRAGAHWRARQTPGHPPPRAPQRVALRPPAPMKVEVGVQRRMAQLPRRQPPPDEEACFT